MFRSAEVTAAFPKEEKKFSNTGLALVTLVSVGAIVAAGWGVALPGSWWITIAFLIVFLSALGLRVHDRIGGALIDEKNLMSLSRFQLVAWTVLLVATIVAIAIARASAGVTAFGFAIPDEVWQLLGITAAGATGKEVVNAVKKRQAVANPEVASTRAAAALNENSEPAQKTTMHEVEEHRTGTLYGNPTAAHASLVDMFQGVEVGNTAYVDISKVQMFFFTIGALVAYGTNVMRMVMTTTADKIAQLPPFDDSLLAILAVSHAAYLTSKAVDHTNVAASDEAQARANAAKAGVADDPAELDG